jgi:hypothetical protein
MREMPKEITDKTLIQKVKIPFKIAKRGKHKPHVIKPNNSIDEKIIDDALVLKDLLQKPFPPLW